MYYVYILKNIKFPDKIYIGYTENLGKRLIEYNEGRGARHTNKFKLWKIETFVSFNNRGLALDLEKYLKVGSGKAFLNKSLVN